MINSISDSSLANTIFGQYNNINKEQITNQYEENNQNQDKIEQKSNKEQKLPGELTEEEKKEVEELKKRDREVRAHEMAHLMAAQGIAISGPHYEYKRGPDGVMYAVGGDVKIDVSEVRGNPEATIRKAEKVERAALAPRDPSPQDRKVANEARMMKNKARMELMKKKQEEMKKAYENNSGNSGFKEINSTTNISGSINFLI